MPDDEIALAAYAFRRNPSHVLLGLALLGFASAHTSAATPDEAEIVSLQGRGEAKETSQSDWHLATIRQRLRGGAFVRTGDLSQMALLLQDQTQLRLNQNSMLQIKDTAAAGAPTRLDLAVGRVWMQAKGGAARPAGGAPAVVVETPSATAAIRGTDWELTVDGQGVTVLTVLSGEVEFFNAFGRLTVLPNEQARVEPGKAPVKVLLTNARERIQWVTAYRAQPSRWARSRTPALDAIVDAIEADRLGEALPALEAARETSADATLLLADIMLSRGDVAGAIRLLEDGTRRFPADGRIPALLARAYVIADRGTDAAALLDGARRSHAAEVEVWIASGDVARFDGDERAATAAYRTALSLRDASAPAWFGLGVVATEREDVRPARRALGEALRLDPNGPGFLGELGTLETFSDELAAAGNAFDAALAKQPDDYVALTGRGVLLLKRGDPQAALRSFLEAGVLEPRYARAALYTGVAYYQLDRRNAAIEMFNRAAELDPRDPLPYLMLAVVASDDLAWGDALTASRAAVERMPYLKSLNQLLNNQKGYAGVGSAIASFGLEEWAQAYAYEAYTPYWAGSHLFLADRFAGLFNKNSELFQGFLTDPTVFGASNRFSTLVPRPGDYATIVGTVARQDFRAAEAQLVLNGYHNEALPFAYHVSLDGFRFLPVGDEGIDGRSGVATVGLGMRPVHDVGVFLFATKNRTPVTFSDAELGFPGNPVALDSHRVDAGLNLKFAPDSQAWIKAGSGRDRPSLSGEVLVDVEGERIGLDVTSFSSTTRASDWQWRHTVDAARGYQLSWGVEYAKQTLPSSVLLTAPSTIVLGERANTEFRSRMFYASNRFRPTAEWLLQADLGYSAIRKRHARDDLLILPGADPLVLDSATDDRDVDGFEGRAGFAWRLRPEQTLRLAWQQWRRPASVSTLGPVDTAGIPLDDRLVTVGGRLQRVRAQFEWEMTSRTFWQFHADRRRIDNVPNPAGALLPDFELTDLERLRNLIQNNVNTPDLYEDDPEFGAGRVAGGGVALNHILSPTASMAVRYLYQQGRNTTSEFSGNAIPFVPKHLAQIGFTWVALPRLQLSGVATWRSVRYADEANADRLASGWNIALGAYWESLDKRWSLGAAAENLLPDRDAGRPSRPLVGAQVVFRL